MKGYCDLGFAKVDTDRANRRGYPEVIFALGKNNTQLLEISRKIIRARQALLITKISADAYAFLKGYFSKLKYNVSAAIAYLNSSRLPLKHKGFVLIITAGTSDIAVAEEAAVTLEVGGFTYKRLYDVGVAGVHRIIDKRKLLRRARAIIVVAGMEGALPSIVSGLVRCPVIAVPTSVGYGASFKGLSALLTMLNSCSPGVAVMNIDNGFGAGYFAGLVIKNK